MLELRNICREYHSGDTVTKALDHVSITFRDNEFTAILGPSGSGKTTLLNIIGGLDRYTSGDLVINGVSTKKYTDRDFDTYRNHTIGFIFQGYNLISHQTVLANVELALTISGISGREKRERAVAALEKVGLKDHLYKKPAQLSGGQMQRVAIARALVNDPDIVLADEPTGALDTRTSIQVMDLLKEVAQDREVIMVTHNPALAEQYATRIVTIQDGKIKNDTNPLRPSEHFKARSSHFRHTAMNFLTALSLSFNNLKTKKGRTFMVSFAGSIGIIGIALLLAINTGLSAFIETEESEALSAYPLEIYDTGIDVSSLLNSSTQTAEQEKKQEKAVTSVKVNRMAEEFLSSVNANDLSSLKAYLDSPDSGIDRYASDVEYSYGIVPQIYHMEADGSALQVNPSRAIENLVSGSMDISSLLNSTINVTAFHALPSKPSLYQDAYTVEAGRWPKNDDEMVLVLSGDGKITDLLLYELGIWDSTHLTQMVHAFTSENNSSALLNLAGSAESTDESKKQSESSRKEEKDTYNVHNFLKLKYRLVRNSDSCSYDENLGLWVDHSNDVSYMNEKAAEGQQLKVVGVVKPMDSSSLLSPGIYYRPSLITHLMQEEKNSEPVKAQLSQPDTDIFTGRKFSEENSTSYDYGKFFYLDHDEVARAFIINTGSINENTVSSLLHPAMENIMYTVQKQVRQDIAAHLSSFDLSAYLTADSLKEAIPSLSEGELETLLKSIRFQNSAEIFQTAVSSLVNSYLSWYQSQYGDFESMMEKIEQSFLNYLTSSDAEQLMTGQLQQYLSQTATRQIHALNQDEIQQILTEEIQAYLSWLQNSGTETALLDPADGGVMQLYFANETGQQRLNALVQRFMPSVDTAVDEKEVKQFQKTICDGFRTYAVNNGIVLPDENSLAQSLYAYLGTAEARTEIQNVLNRTLDLSSLEAAAENLAEKKLQNVSASLQQQFVSVIETEAEKAMQEGTASLMDTAEAAASKELTQAAASTAAYINAHTGDFFTVDQEAFRNSIHMNMDSEQIQSILRTLLSGSKTDLSSNLKKLGYADEDTPSLISIYARTFRDKKAIADVIDTYNEKMKKEGNDDKVISYTDVIAAMMDSITDIISTVAEILIAFVAISLVVSSIMIGVITYISVLERRKEIGILRALGASRHNIREVFNAETFITGLLSGLLGIGLTFLLIPLADHLIQRHTGQIIQAWLPLKYCIGLVALSVFLTVTAGLIPSARAASSDPVKALRTE